jgi:hypothetical protein
MADLGNQKIKDTYQLVLQTDASGNLQKLDGSTPNPFIINQNLRYLDGTTHPSGYVLVSDGSGNASWGAVAFSGDVYISGGSIEGTTIQLQTTSGNTISIPGLAWSSSTSGHISNSGLTGNVGIGTSTPNEKLTVAGDISGSTDVHVGNDLSVHNDAIINGSLDLIGGSAYIKDGGTTKIAFGTPSILKGGDWKLIDGLSFAFDTQSYFKAYRDTGTGRATLSSTNGGVDITSNSDVKINTSTLYLGNTTSEVTVQDNLVVNDDLTVNTNTLYASSSNSRVGVNTLYPDAVLSVTNSGTSEFTPFNLQGGDFTVVNNNTRIRFNSPANTTGLATKQLLQFTIGATTYIVTIDSVDAENVFLTENFTGPTTSSVDALNYNVGVLNRIFKVYDNHEPVFQVSGSTVMSGTTDLLDIFSTASMSGTVVSVGITGTDGIEVDSGSPITDSGTITLGLNDVDATKIADGSVTDTEFQYINTLSSNAQTQLDAKLPLAGGTMAGVIAMGTNKITGLGNPTAAQDATTKAYVDSLDVNYWSANTDGSITNSGNTDITTSGNLGISGNTSFGGTLSGTGTVTTLSPIVAASYNSTTSTSGYQLNGTKYLWRDGDYLQVGNTTGTVPNTDIIGKSINLQTATTINDNLTVTGNTNISGNTNINGNLGVSGNTDLPNFQNGTTIIQCSFSLKTFSTNNWASHPAAQGGLNTEFWTQDTGVDTLPALYQYYNTQNPTVGNPSPSQGAFCAPATGKLRKIVFNGANSTGALKGDDLEIEIARAPVTDGQSGLTYTQLTGITHTLPDNTAKRFIIDCNFGGSGVDVAANDVFLVAFKTTESSNAFIRINLSAYFEYSLPLIT